MGKLFKKTGVEWVLRLNGDLYFREMTAIGPRCTDDITEAVRFPTMKAAKQHEAYSFSFMVSNGYSFETILKRVSFEPMKVRRKLKKVRSKDWLG